jgi:hypothetical protein
VRKMWFADERMWFAEGRGGRRYMYARSSFRKVVGRCGGAHLARRMWRGGWCPPASGVPGWHVRTREPAASPGICLLGYYNNS